MSRKKSALVNLFSRCCIVVNLFLCAFVALCLNRFLITKRKAIRRTFQLLEILIAFFLVIVCAIPLIQTYVAMHIEQKEQNHIIEADQLVEEVHAKLVEDFYKKRLGLQNLEDPQEHEIDDDSIVKRAKNLGYKITYKFELTDPKKISDKTSELIAAMHIMLGKIDEPNSKKTTVTYNLYATVSK